MLLAAAATAAALLLAALAGHVELIAYVAPVFALGIPLVAGRYPGEETLDRLRARREPAPRFRTAAPLGGVRRAAAWFPRGGRLIARALAERAPPIPGLT
jgi:hypothetical protein